MKKKRKTKARISIEELKKRIFKIHKNLITVDDKTYINVNTKARFIDKDFGEWWALPINVYRLGIRHPKNRTKKSIEARHIPIEEIKRRLLIVHGDEVIIDEITYSNTIKKARFIDKQHGEWWATPNNILNGRSHPNREREKIQETCMMRYGVKHSHQNKDIYSKVLKSIKTACHIKHWKTGETVVCRGSYERKVVDWLNENQINFEWQLPFTTPIKTKSKKIKSVYWIDIFLPEKKLYIEIKGYMRKHSEKKWNWFHKTYPNSELWDKKKLEELGII